MDELSKSDDHNVDKSFKIDRYNVNKVIKTEYPRSKQCHHIFSHDHLNFFFY